MTTIHAVHHHLQRMTGRDPRERGRVATTLELLYDLTIVVAFGVAGSEFAHALAAGHLLAGSAAFIFVLFAVCWAWMNSTWFDSAFDTDDWFVRLATMVQMVGLVVLTTGIPELFAGFDHGWQLRNQTIVLGYVVMRVPLVLLWWRASRDVESARLRTATRRTAGWIVVIQVFWSLVAVLDVPPALTVAVAATLFALEMAVPYQLEKRAGGLPWHPHHLAERYSLLVIIALGEVIVGTSASVSALYERHGWTLGVALVLVAGVALAMALWWLYFSVPFGEVLARHPGRLFRFTYPHLAMYFSIAGVGAGLHVAAYQVEGESVLGVPGTVAAVVLPTAAFVLLLFGMVAGLLRHPLLGFHLIEIVLTVALLAAAPLLALVGAPLELALPIAVLAPWVAVVAYEWRGYRHLDGWLAEDA